MISEHSFLEMGGFLFCLFAFSVLILFFLFPLKNNSLLLAGSSIIFKDLKRRV